MTINIAMGGFFTLAKDMTKHGLNHDNPINTEQPVRFAVQSWVFPSTLTENIYYHLFFTDFDIAKAPYGKKLDKGVVEIRESDIDLSVVLPPTAAGEISANILAANPMALGSSTSAIVFVEFINSRGHVEAGFDTTSRFGEFSRPFEVISQEITLLPRTIPVVELASETSGPIEPPTHPPIIENTLNLSATPSILESGGKITYTATLSNAVANDTTITLSNNLIIIIPAGQTSGYVTQEILNHEDVYLDAETISVNIKEVSGNSENLQINKDQIVTEITDTIDTTTVNLGNVTVNEGGTVTLTASVDNPPQTDLTLMLSNGQVITILAGQTSGSVTFPAPTDNAYLDTGSQTISISNATGGNYEQLDTSDTATITVQDTIDTTTVTLGDVTVNEGGNITLTANVENAPQNTPLTITLSNGEVITIAVGQTSGSVTFPAPTDDAYIDAGSQTISISNATGGNYEQLDTSDTATITVQDTIDTTTVTLGDVTVNEGGNITLTANVENAPKDTPLTITLSNGEIITIAVGQTSGSVTFPAPTDDAYIDAGSQTISISNATGGNYEQLDTSDTATITVQDTIDTTTVTLGDVTVNEGGNITLTANVENAPKDTPLTITLSNGEIITIAVGQTSGSVTFPAPTDDAYIDADSQTISISNATGGNYEQLDTSDTATVTVQDTIDTTTVTLGDVTVNEGGMVTLTANVNNAPQTDLTLTLSNGEVITILAGQTSGSVTFPAPTDDAYIDADSQTISISNATGGNYEQLDTNDTATITVQDTIDTTTVTLSDVTVNEGGTITLTANVNNAPETDLTLTLSNGQVITILAGQTSGSVTFPAPTDDAYIDADSQTISISNATGGNYEQLDTSDTATITVQDTIDTTTVTLGDVTVDEGGMVTLTANVENAPQNTPLVITLSNGEIITIAVGQTSGSVTFPAPTDDAYIDADSQTISISSAAGGNYEQLDISDTATITVQDTIDTTLVELSDVTVDEGGNITLTANVENAPQNTPLVITLSNGEIITIAVGQTSGSVTFPAPTDDAYIDADSQTISISNAIGGNYEQLDTSDTATITVQDTIDTTTVTLSDVTVNEGGTITLTANVNNAPQTDLTLTLSNGQVITILAGQTSGSVTFPAPTDDAYIDAGSQTISISNAIGGNYEQLDTSDTATITVQDTIDTTTVTLGDVTVNEGGTITLTANVENAPQNTPLVITLSNGEIITIAVGQTSGSVTFPAPTDDAYIDAGTQTISISSATGGNYEQLDTSDTATITIQDTIDTTAVTLGDVTVNEGGMVTLTANVENAPQNTPLVITLSNGEIITIAVGQTSGSVTFPAPTDDAYIDAGTQTISISSATGGNYEQLDTSDTATITIQDTIDTTAVTLGDVTVNEGGMVTLTANVENAPQNTPLVITLSNGEIITIAVGQTSGSVTFPAPTDDAYIDAGTQTISISSATGGNYEQLDTSDTATITVQDTIDTTAITLGDVTVNEGGTITLTANVENAPQDTPLTITLSNGEIITIAMGQTSGSVTFPAPTDDAYIDAGTQTISISSATGGNYESLNTSDTATITVQDTIDTTAITLGDVTVNEGGTITLTANVENAPQNTPLVITLSNGEIITIAVGQTSGSVTFPAPTDDAYIDAGSQTISISNATGGNYEQLDTSDTATITIQDTIDTTAVTLGDVTVNEGGMVTLTANVENAPQNTPLVITLSNGEIITIAVGQTSGSVTFPAPTDDAYIDAGTQTISISSATGGNYEQLDTSDTATITIQDTIDTTAVTLGDVTVNEGGMVTLTANVENAPKDTPLTITLSNGEIITIAVGQTSGSVTFPAPTDDAYIDAGTQTISISDALGGNYENLNTSDTATITVQDTIDITTVTLGDITVNEGGMVTLTANVNNAPQTDLTLTLSNGEIITILAGQTSGSVTFPAPTDDAYIDADSQTISISNAAGGNYESLNTSDTATITVQDTIDTTTVTLGDVTVNEGGTITLTANVNNAPQTDLTLTLSNGQVITILAGQTSGSVTFPAPTDDAYIDADSQTISISSAAGGNYEQLDTSDTATITVQDTINTTTVTLGDVTVNEGGTITLTANVNNAPQTDLTLTLSNGEVITILAGQTSGSVTFPAPTDDAYIDADSQTISISSAAGGNYEQLDTSDTATITVQDTIDTTTVTLGDVTVNEGGTITLTANVNNAPETDLTLTLSNGQVITILAGQTSGSVTFPAPTDDAYIDADSQTISISNAAGGNYEQLDTSDTATITINDTVDTTTVILGDVTVNEGGTITLTANVNNAPQTDLTLTLSNGEVITILAGQTSGSVTFPAPTDDAYINADSQTISISSAAGGNYEQLDTSDTATITVQDTIDTTTVTLGDVTVNEGGTITLTANVNNAPETDLTLTLSNGQVITILAGQTSGSVTFPAPTDDAYIDADSQTISISNAAGGNYEQLDTSDTATITINDTVDTTTVILGDVTVNEGGTITLTANVNNAPQTDLTLTLSNGEVITILAGQTSGSVTFPAPTDDAYINADSQTISISSAAGGNYESLNTSDTATITVQDTIDTTTVTLGDVTVNEGGTITLTANVNNAPQTDLTLTLSNGEVITILAGQTSGSVTFPAPTDDAYVDAGTQTISISNATGGNYEQLDTSDTATITVQDTIDTTTVTLGDVTVNEGGTITLTANVNNAPQTDLTLTLSNGEVITIFAGQTSGSVTFPAPTDDAYIDADSQTISISNAAGGNYEQLDTSDTATITVQDTIDTTTVTLGDVTVNEGGTITLTANVNNAPQTDLTLTLSNGEVITILAGQTSGSVTFPAPTDDAYIDAGTQTISISNATGGNYESLNTSDTATITVQDTIDTTTVTLGDVTVNEGGTITLTANVNNAPETDLTLTLSNGQVITILAGQTSGSVTFPAPTDDAYIDADSQTISISNAAGGNYEQLNTSDTATITVQDTIDTTTVTLGDVTVNEGGTITLTANVNNAPQTDLTLTLSNGQVITILAGQTSGSVTFPAPTDDAYVDAGTQTISISNATGGNYEQLDTSDTATITVQDTINTTTVTLGDVTVNEGGTITLTANVNNAPQTDLTLTLSNGQVITILAGQTSGSVTFPAPTDDAYVDADSQTISISNAAGGNYEQLDISDTATITVQDTINTTTVTLGDVTVNEGGMVTLTANVNNAPQTDLTLTLSNGQVITILAGQTSGSVTFPAPTDDAYIDADSQTISISNATGGNYEQLNTSDTATITIQDTIDTTTVTLGDVTVNEGGSITLTANVNNAPETDLTLTLSNGEVITILAGQTSGSVTFPAPTDDAYIDAGTQTISISNAIGGNYEQLDTSDTATITVQDIIDTTTVTLGDVTVNEGGTITLTANVNNAPQTDLTLTLSNGEIITILAGQTSGSVTFPAPTDDAYIDADSQTISISSAVGGNYEQLDTSDTATITVQDTIDTTLVELSDVTVDEGGNITLTANVENAPQNTPLVITLSNGEIITIAVGQTSGSVTFPAPTDDAYIDAGSQTISISNAVGGNYEQLNTSDTATITVQDTIDTTLVELSDVTVDEGGMVTLTANVENAPQNTPLVITLSNGEIITIAVGQTSGSVTFPAPTDDAYIDAGSQTISISNATGGNYEQLDTSDTATITVQDTIDTTLVELSDV
ncbi:immunoglobulin-like domain-containing protein, partial [Legionella septentrionalis]|uniref:immunoglobulin-like domain-containing protein n=1 Tax=Legionella septentrionalis TaxID=2498109 RepID=UPI000FB17219